MNEAPRAVDPAIDMRDADRYRRRGAPVDGDLAALEADGVGEVAALEGDDILGHQRAASEAAAHPAERLGEAVVTLLDRPPGSDRVASSEAAQQWM
jgi:hypothetical protein